MQYYNSAGEVVEYNYELSTHHGGCSHIYLLEKNIALKEYYTYTHGDIEEEVFNVLKSIDNPNFVKLIEYYYKSNPINENGDKKDDIRIDSYIYNYIPADNIDIIETELEYFLYNLSLLEKLFKLFTKLRIRAADCKAENTVLTNDYIVVIDPDMFRIDNGLKYKTDIVNKYQLLNLFKSIFIFYSKNRVDIDNDKIYSLFTIDVKRWTCVTDEITKRLSLYKRPIDYLKK